RFWSFAPRRGGSQVANFQFDSRFAPESGLESDICLKSAKGHKRLSQPTKGSIMPATIIDSLIFGNIFSTDAMKAVWSDESRTQKYLEVEAALARVQAHLGIIPQN